MFAIGGEFGAFKRGSAHEHEFMYVSLPDNFEIESVAFPKKNFFFRFEESKFSIVKLKISDFSINILLLLCEILRRNI